MEERKIPGYYAILPAEVRYDNRLKANEKLLYAEITALANKSGYCYATNRYFANLYNVIIGTISRWIAHLEELGYIKTAIIKGERNEVLERRIFLSNTYEQNNTYPIGNFAHTSISKKAKDNNMNFNNIKKNTQTFRDYEQRQYGENSFDGFYANINNYK